MVFFVTPCQVTHCVPVSRLIQNTFVLACIINLHRFALRQQGIQSTCSLCQPPPSLFVWDCDTKKLTPCIFITITSEETTNLIEYVIAPGIEVGSAHCVAEAWAGRWISGLEDNKCSAAEKTKNPRRDLFSLCEISLYDPGAMINTEVKVHDY